MTDDAHSNFATRIKSALEDTQLRSNFRGAMDFLRNKRKQAFSDEEEWQTLREQGAAIRQNVVERLPELLEQLEQQCSNNGIQVHWAETGIEANQIVLDIAQRRKAKLVIKGKSMASEEIELNNFLQSHNIEAIESDMGEYIVQIADETPSHIIMPAIHKNKQEIAQLFEKKLKLKCDPNDVDGMIGLGRRILRDKFEKADIGISGVNFAAAESGTLCLVENEGNGRLSTTAPPVHIAIMGLEKVIPSLRELPTLQRLLTRSATGQHITSYLNLISSPRQAGELDGPEEVHLIILDNGRSLIQQDPELKTTLACIRCGACMNHCPVYTKIGGHAYGTTYPGPIGQVVMPQLKGMASHGELLNACSLNGACGEACPVDIKLPQLIRSLRNKQQATGSTLKVESWIWRLWKVIHTHPKLYRLVTKLMGALPFISTCYPKAWRNTRTPARPSARTLHERLKHSHQKFDGQSKEPRQ
ncbi:(Fe-S)-binding protein [Oleiphilus sp. HI0068]|jgi:L-lactate dehydrogenase complex protein LldF|nr:MULTISPECIES: LutB/LldF family L-lactate oxidation iron-sulfur protein [unclassified Oleiphilus]KZY78132.1 (Fe-S)-binding protein [Oleiphilus sp. HI0069]KZY78292.1 (Fe-S)-binding protein [Oleiphilus sp. HI0068]KZZ40942.1 (Fe-S)-binding protein [Oleiphilus sp. HI0085]KZY36996.1 (Fe-S)-binding protein [Oleiphilus sp. HI0043]KZY56758.1 (Fe-S)-binding protein [Oleiphilus sp. HI0061]